MSTILFANNANTVLGAPISQVATTITLATGTGQLFPNPQPGQYFVGTISDAVTGLITEIVYCTARSADTLTVIRGQENTTPLAWDSTAIFANLWTAGQAADLAADTGTIGGSIGVNPYRILLGLSAQPITSITYSGLIATVTTQYAHGLSTGMSVRMVGQVPAAYTGQATITVTGTYTFTYPLLVSPGASASTLGLYVVSAQMQPGQVLTINGTVTVSGVPVAFTEVQQAFSGTSDNTLAIAAALLSVSLNNLAAGFIVEMVPSQNIIQVDSQPSTVFVPNAAATAIISFNAGTSAITGTGTIPALSFDQHKRSLTYAEVNNASYNLASGATYILPLVAGTLGTASAGIVSISAIGGGSAAGEVYYDCQIGDEIWTSKGVAFQGSAGTSTTLALQSGYSLTISCGLPNMWSVESSGSGLVTSTQFVNNPPGTVNCNSGWNNLLLVLEDTSASLGALTVGLPASPNDNDEISIYCGNFYISALTLSGGSVIGWANGTTLPAKTVLHGAFSVAAGNVWLFDALPTTGTTLSSQFISGAAGTLTLNTTLTTIGVDTSAGVVTATLPAPGVIGRKVTFTDYKGDAQNYLPSAGFTLSPPTGGTISGQSSWSINTAYGSFAAEDYGTTWCVVGSA